MSIQKNTTILIKKHKLAFSVIINSTMSLIKDPATLGIYIYLQSKPENWVIREKELMSRFNKGRDFIRARLKELKDCGLMVTKSTRSPEGKIIGWTTTLYSYLPDNDNASEFAITHSLEEENKARKTINSEEHPVTKKAIIKKTPKKNPLNQNPDQTEAGETRILVNPTHTNNRLSLVKKETTTTIPVEDVLNSQTIDEELAKLRDAHMPHDERESEEFVKQCKWHLEHGDKTKYNFSQRFAGLKKLICLKRFEAPANYPSKKKGQTMADIARYSEYANRIKSDIFLGLLPRQTRTLSFEEWRKQG